MVSISIIMSTARDNFPIIGMPNLHLFHPTIESLKSQSFKDFEMIVVDGLYHLRSNLFEGKDGSLFGLFDKKELKAKYGFEIKHIPVEHNSIHNHGFWLDHRRWNVCGQLNSCLIHARGQLVVRLDDCCEFDSEYLKRIWDSYLSGLWLQGMHIRYLEGKPARLDNTYRNIGYETSIKADLLGEGSEERKKRDDILKSIFGEGGLIRDTRWKTVVEKGGRIFGEAIPASWLYGYSCFELESALRINGFDERFDGQKSLEDSDFGSRLSMVDGGVYRKKWLLDIGHQIIEHEHIGVSEKIIDSRYKPIVCNYSLYRLNQERGKEKGRSNGWMANSDILSKEDIEFVRTESLRHPCSPNGVTGHYEEDLNNRYGGWFDIWLKNQGIFDLREERKLYGL